MTLSSRHRIRNSNPGGLRPSTLPLGHGGSPQYWLSHVDGEETFFVSFKPPRPGKDPQTLAWKVAVLTTTLGPPPFPGNEPVKKPRKPESVRLHVTSVASLYHVHMLTRSHYWLDRYGRVSFFIITGLHIIWDQINSIFLVGFHPRVGLPVVFICIQSSSLCTL